MTVSGIVERIFRSSRSQRRKGISVQHRDVAVEVLEKRALLTLIGTEVTVTNQFRSTSLTNMDPPTLFAGPEQVTAETRATPELTSFADLYDINIEATTISLINNAAANPVRPPAAPPFVDIYEFRVDGLDTNQRIVGVSADMTQSLVPQVELVGGNLIRVEIDPFQSTGPGFDAVINVDIQPLSPPLTGKDFTVRNTIQSNLGTGGTEVPNGTPVTAAITDGATDPEITSFVGAYDIDVDAASISMVFNHDPSTGPDPSGALAAGTFDRYYFDIDLLPSEFLASATVNPNSTLQPGVTILDDNSLVVEIGPGSVIGNGFDTLIDLQIGVRGSAVSGRIWQDVNNDGVRNPGEGWLNGFEVELRSPNGNVVGRTVSRNIDLNNDGFINPATERGLYLFEGIQTGTYRVAQLPRPQWVQTSPVEAGGSDPALVALRNQLGLIPSPNEFFNYAGLQEKWLLSDTSVWYYITPDGTLTQWDGTSGRSDLMGTVIATLSTTVYDDPSLLSNASPPATQTIDVLSPAPTSGPDFGNFLAPPNSWGINLVDATNSAEFIWHPAEILPQGTIQIWISDLGAGQQLELVSGLTGENFTRNGFADGRYRAWARIEYAPGVFSGWTRAIDFEFQRAAVVLPFNSGLHPGIDATPTLGWSAVTDAVSYDIEVLPIVDGNGTVISPGYSANGVSGLSHRVATPLLLGSHQVRFRANFADGSRTAWSVPQSITVTGRPTVTVTGNVVRWDAVKAATQYELWIDSVDSNGNRITRQFIYEPDVQGLEFTLPNIPRGGYAVWVRAIRAEAGLRHPSFWSARVDFTVADTTLNESLELLPEFEFARVNTDDVDPPNDAPTETRLEQQPEVRSDPSEHNVKMLDDSDSELLEVMMEIAAGELLDATT